MQNNRQTKAAWMIVISYSGAWNKKRHLWDVGDEDDDDAVHKRFWKRHAAAKTSGEKDHGHRDRKGADELDKSSNVLLQSCLGALCAGGKAVDLADKGVVSAADDNASAFTVEDLA
jgi:hypothetical protein